MTARTESLLTLADVAERLNVPVNTARHWRHQGTGPRMFRVGRELRCDPKDLEAWIRARKAETGDLSASRAVRAVRTRRRTA